MKSDKHSIRSFRQSRGAFGYSKFCEFVSTCNQQVTLDTGALVAFQRIFGWLRASAAYPESFL